MKIFLIISAFLVSITCRSQSYKYSIQTETLKSSLGLFNVGWEVFVKSKDSSSKEQNSFIPAVAITNTKEYKGWEISMEYRFYESCRFGKSWKEYLSARVDYGNFTYHDFSSAGLRKNYFGIVGGGGLRKYFFNHLFFDLSTNMGYFNNVSQLNGILYSSKINEPFSTQFSVEARICIGWAF
ncbi:MAG: DUF3575 domain-containing protein [Flavobacterium sp.]|jgi:hypothetical protein|uniref:DUF3575 domain-containing protein n=1 Tax=Flavobacterium sp. TaxID=239 RepID=UPI003BCC8A43